MSERWSFIEAARHVDWRVRTPFGITTAAGVAWVGSVGSAHDGALASLAPLMSTSAGWVLDCPVDERARHLDRINRRLFDAGCLWGWRDERYAVLADEDGEALCTVERCSARFWGLLTQGAHCNGYVAGATGRPTHLWIGQRSFDKATDPGKLDNLVGGGVPAGQTPWQTLVREGWEEAGLAPERMRQARFQRVYRIARDVPEGVQREELHVYDIALPAGETPRNQDGEVAEFRCLPIDEAAECSASGQMTVDAALVTLDFLLRHQLLALTEAARLSDRIAAAGV